MTPKRRRRRDTPNAPRDLSLDPTEARAAAEALIERAGVSPSARSRSQRHGHCPRARRDVENYLLARWWGVPARQLAETLGLRVRAVYYSLERGEHYLLAFRESEKEAG